MHHKRHLSLSQIQKYCLKLPGIYLLMITVILVDFLIQLPFILICSFEDLFRKSKEQ